MNVKLPIQVFQEIFRRIRSAILKIPNSPKDVSFYWRGSKAEYDSILGGKNQDALYFVEEEANQTIVQQALAMTDEPTDEILTSDLHFNNDGTKLFVHYSQKVGSVPFFRKDTNSYMQEFVLSTPYDISTAVSSGVSGRINLFDFSEYTGLYNRIESCAFSSDGTKLFFLDSKGAGTSDNTVNCIDLPTPWSLSGATLDPTNKFIRQEAYEFGISQDGLKLLISTQSAIVEIRLGTAFRLNTQQSITQYSIGVFSGAGAAGLSSTMKFSDDGYYLFVVSRNTVYRTQLNNPFDLSSRSGSYKVLYVIDDQYQIEGGFEFGKDGNSLFFTMNSRFVTNTSVQEYLGYINEFELLAPYDLTTTSTKVKLYLGDKQVNH